MPLSVNTQPVSRALSEAIRQFAWFAAVCVVAFSVPYLGVSVLDLQHDLFYLVYFAVTIDGRDIRPRRGGRHRHHLPAPMALESRPRPRARGLPRLQRPQHRGRDSSPGRHLLRLRNLLARRRLRPRRHAAVDRLPVLRRAQAPARPRRRRQGEGAVHGADASTRPRHHRDLPLGYPQYRENGLCRPETGNVLITIPTVATANPAGSFVAHVSQHVAAVTHAYESEIFNPPVTKS